MLWLFCFQMTICLGLGIYHDIGLHVDAFFFIAGRPRSCTSKFKGYRNSSGYQPGLSLFIFYFLFLLRSSWHSCILLEVVFCAVPCFHSLHGQTEGCELRGHPVVNWSHGLVDNFGVFSWLSTSNKSKMCFNADDRIIGRRDDTNIR
jgi:hypothetical protein